MPCKNTTKAVYFENEFQMCCMTSYFYVYLTFVRREGTAYCYIGYRGPGVWCNLITVVICFCNLYKYLVLICICSSELLDSYNLSISVEYTVALFFWLWFSYGGTIHLYIIVDKFFAYTDMWFSVQLIKIAVYFWK